MSHRTTDEALDRAPLVSALAAARLVRPLLVVRGMDRFFDELLRKMSDGAPEPRVQ